VVRVRGEFLHVRAEIVRAGNGAQFFFPLAFGAGRFGGVAEERLLVGGDVVADGSSEVLTKRMDAIATVRFIVPPEIGGGILPEEGAIWKRGWCE